jgi:K+/H+ antiporter YhaU regulatory subunit KhtT
VSPQDTIAAIASQKEKIAEIICLLADKDKFEQRLNAIRAIAENADKKMRDASAQAEKFAMADRMLADATAMLADHTAREAQLKSREISVAEREKAVAERERKFKAAASVVK